MKSQSGKFQLTLTTQCCPVIKGTVSGVMSSLSPGMHEQYWRKACLLQRTVHGPAMSSPHELGKALFLSGLQLIQWQNGADMRIQ